MLDENVPSAGSPSCGCAEQASEEELMSRLDEMMAGYKGKPGALIPVLQQAQAIFGYLPPVVQRRIARELGEPLSKVFGVLTFYSFFSTVPRGRYLVRVCLGTACYVRDGKEVLAVLKKELGIDVGQTTEDRLFSLDVGRCFGACGLAPVIMVNEDVHQRLKPAKVGEVLAAYQKADGGSA